MGLFDHLFKSKSPPPPSEENPGESGASETEAAPRGDGGTASQRADPAGFLHPKSFVPRGVTALTPPAKSGALSGVRKLGGPSAPPAPAEEIVLLLGDVLSRIPTHYLKKGQHDPKREMRFSINDLSSDIARGRAAVPLSRIAQLLPDIFVTQIGRDEDTEVRLPLQKLVEQIGLLRARPAGGGNEKILRPISPPAVVQLLRPSSDPEIHLAPESDAAETLEPAPEPLVGLLAPAEPIIELKPLAGAAAPLFIMPEPAREQKPPAAEPEPPVAEAGQEPEVETPVGETAESPVSAESPAGLEPAEEKVDELSQEPPAIEEKPAADRAVGVATAPEIVAELAPAPAEVAEPPEPENPVAIEKELTLPAEEKPAAAVLPGIATAEPVETDAPGERIELSLAAILRGCPREIIVGELPEVPDNVRISLPFAPIDRQLVSGRVEVSAIRFVAALPFSYQKLFSARIGVKVPIPLEEVFQNLPSPATSATAPAAVELPGQKLAPAAEVFAPALASSAAEVLPLNPDVVDSAKNYPAPLRDSEIEALNPQILNAAMLEIPPAPPDAPEIAPDLSPIEAPAPATALTAQPAPEAPGDADRPLPPPVATDAPFSGEAPSNVVPLLDTPSADSPAADAPPAADSAVPLTLPAFHFFTPPPPLIVVEAVEPPSSPTTIFPTLDADRPEAPGSSRGVVLGAETLQFEGVASEPVAPVDDSETSVAENVIAVGPADDDRVAEIVNDAKPEEPAPEAARPPAEEGNSPAVFAEANQIIPPPQMFRPFIVLPPPIIGFTPAPVESDVADLALDLGEELKLSELPGEAERPLSAHPIAEAEKPAFDFAEDAPEKQTPEARERAFEIDEATPSAPPSIISIDFTQALVPHDDDAALAEAMPLLEVTEIPPAEPAELAFVEPPADEKPPEAPENIEVDAEPKPETAVDLAEQNAADLMAEEAPSPTEVPAETLAPAIVFVAEGRFADRPPKIVPVPEPEPDFGEVVAEIAAPVSDGTPEAGPLLTVPHFAPEMDPVEALDVLPPPALALRRFDQDALQALFMTDETLDLPRISRLAAQLPGVHACVIATRDQACTGGTLPEGFDLAALLGLAPRVGEAAGRMPIGSLKHFTLYGEQYSVSFFERNGLSLCAVHRPRSFVPGVREKLVAIADELSK